MNMLITGGWDKTLRFWDCRSPAPVHTQALPERVYAMDVTYPLVRHAVIHALIPTAAHCFVLEVHAS